MAAMLSELVPRVDGYFGHTCTPAETNDRVRAFMSLFIGHFMTSMVLGAAPTDHATVDAMLKIMDWDA